MRRHKDFIIRRRMTEKNTNQRHWVHTNENHEVLMVLQGEATFSVEGKMYHMEPYDMLIISNQEIHCVNANNDLDYERTYIYFSPEYFQTFNTRHFDILSIFGPKHDKKNKIGHEIVRAHKLDEKMLEIYDLSVSEKPERWALMTARLLEFLVEVNTAFEECYADAGENLEIAENEKISDIILYISEHLHEKITLDELVDKFYISKFYLCHEFKLFTGMTVLNYIRYKKMLAAKMQLQEGRPLGEVWLEFGFEDYSNFYRNFKKVFDISPQDYIKEMEVRGTEAYESRS